MFTKQINIIIAAVSLMLSVVVMGAAPQSRALSMQDVYDNWYILTDAKTNSQAGIMHQQVRKNDRIRKGVEELSVDDNGGTVGYKAEVRYDRSNGVRAQSADVTTYLDGVPYLTAGIKITNEEMIMVGSETDKQGKPTGPAQTERFDLPKNSAVVFRQGLCSITPLLLAGKNELGDVLFVYCPSEPDVPAEAGIGYVLKKTDKGGAMIIELIQPRGQDIVCRLEVDSEGVKQGTIFNTTMMRTTKQIALSGVKTGSHLSGN